MQTRDFHIGLDVGTSGARATIIDDEAEVVSSGSCSMSSIGPNVRNPHVWLAAARRALTSALNGVEHSRVASFCVDATSGTMLAVDKEFRPMGDALMYNDVCPDEQILAQISEYAPDTTAAKGASSALARAITLQHKHKPAGLLHQADWIAGQLSGIYASDDNNALKTGYDPIAKEWPVWVGRTGLEMGLLPLVNRPGTILGEMSGPLKDEYNLPNHAVHVAGTTDGCASFLATGAQNAGDGVTALGTTMTIKLLSPNPVFSPQHGIYSHQLLGNWLVGGASNTGGAVLLQHFTPEELQKLSLEIDASTQTQLNYYPLPKRGERFPISDPDYAPRLSPRPDDPAEFLKGIFEGIASIEKRCFELLETLGGGRLKSLRSVGGGSANSVWTEIRKSQLGVTFAEPLSGEASFGTALLAKHGARS